MKKTLLSWSSGKDSAWALHLLRTQPELARQLEVVGLLAAVNQQFHRVAMHGTREDLLRRQAEAAGVPLQVVPLPWPCSNAEYESAMERAWAWAVGRGVEVVAFGDLFLRDIRDYREKQLQPTGLTPIFPLWELPTDRLARDMIAGGLRAKLVCVDPKKLEAHFAGREFDEQLLAELPASVDPCGENGEFHTCAYAGPMYRAGIELQVGEVVEREGFVYADVWSPKR